MSSVQAATDQTEPVLPHDFWLRRSGIVLTAVGNVLGTAGFAFAAGDRGGLPEGMLPKSVLITGASRGIGRGIAIELAKSGHRIAINYAGNAEAAAEALALVKAAGGDGFIVQGDVAVAADRERMVGETVAKFGRIDLLVNNAGVAEKKIVTVGSSDDSLQEVLNGVVAGDMVITGPYKILRHLKAGDHVKVADKEKAES